MFLFYYHLVKNLLIITQKVDEQDDLLGFFVGWLREFSKKFNKIFVITLFKGRYNLPENVLVYSLGKEKGTIRFLRYPNFYRLLFKLVPKSDIIFAHMSPIFAVASWPVAEVFRKKIILWYLHRSVTPRLKLAEALCYKIATADRESLNIKSKKILEVGHGIDVSFFRTSRSFSSNKLDILSIGRISPIKNYETLIRAARILKNRGLNFKIKIIGQPVMKNDFPYFESLKNLVSELNLNEYIQFVGFIPYSNMPKFYREADLLVNLAPQGGLDKVVLEAMASGLAVIISNQAFKKYLTPHQEALIFEYNNEKSLAEKIVNFYNFDFQKKKEISEKLYQSVLENHNLANLTERLALLYE